MVDALVSGASALRHVGSSPILGTRNKSNSTRLLLFRMPMGQLYASLTHQAKRYPSTLSSEATPSSLFPLSTLSTLLITAPNYCDKGAE